VFKRYLFHKLGKRGRKKIQTLMGSRLQSLPNPSTLRDSSVDVLDEWAVKLNEVLHSVLDHVPVSEKYCGHDYALSPVVQDAINAKYRARKVMERTNSAKDITAYRRCEKIAHDLFIQHGQLNWQNHLAEHSQTPRGLYQFWKLFSRRALPRESVHMPDLVDGDITHTERPAQAKCLAQNLLNVSSESQSPSAPEYTPGYERNNPQSKVCQEQKDWKTLEECLSWQRRISR
jgi:hypothetical protein